MTFYTISALINLITSFLLGFFIFLKNPKKSINISFLFLSISVSVWSLAYFIWQISSQYEGALFWVRILSIGSTLIPISYLTWVLFFLGLNKDKKRIFVLLLGYIISIIFLCFSFSNLFIKDVSKALSFNFWPHPGPLYFWYLIFSYAGLVGYGLVELIVAYFKRTGIIRYQIKYIILGTIVGFLGGATNFFLWYNVPIPPFGNILVSLYPLILSYAMIKYRLMDIRVVFRKIFIYIGMAGITYGIFYFIVWAYTKLFGGVFNINSYLAGILIAPLFVAFLFWSNKFFINIANKYLFFSLYNYQETISKLTSELNYNIDLDKIINSIVDTIKQTMQLDKAGVLLIKKENNKIHYKVSKVIGFNKENGISLVQDNFLTRYLLKIKKPLVKEEMVLLAKDSKKTGERKNFTRLSQNMSKIEAS